jgi:hypothetical protein
MPNNTGKLSLAERLALVANKHSKAATQKRSNNNLRAKLASLNIQGSSEPMYQNIKLTPKNNTKKNCGAKPSKIWKNKTSKTNEYLAWNACTKAKAAAGGARRKTRRGKKSKRMTRRR